MGCIVFTLWRWWRGSSLTWHNLLLCPQRWLWAGCLPLQTGRQPERYRILCLWHLRESRKFQTLQSHTQKNRRRIEQESWQQRQIHNSDVKFFKNTHALWKFTVKVRTCVMSFAPLEICTTKKAVNWRQKYVANWGDNVQCRALNNEVIWIFNESHLIKTT